MNLSSFYIPFCNYKKTAIQFGFFSLRSLLWLFFDLIFTCSRITAMSIEIELSVYFCLYLFSIQFHSFMYTVTLLSLCVIFLVFLLYDDKSVDEEKPTYCLCTAFNWNSEEWPHCWLVRVSMVIEMVSPENFGTSIWQFYDKWTHFRLQSLVGISLHATTSYIFYNVKRQHLDYIQDVIFL